MLILGAGLAGLTVARQVEKLGVSSYRVLERNSYPGGMASSFALGEFTFDLGIHGLYTKSLEVQNELADAVLGNHSLVDVSIVAYWHGYWTRHPIHFNLASLPKGMVASCLRSFMQAQQTPKSGFDSSFEDWCYQQLGEVISDNFILPYARKFWGVDPSSLTAQWMGPRVKVPTVEQIIDGAILESPPDQHYVSSILYPNSGGFASYANGLSAGLKVHYDCEVIEIDLYNRLVTTRDGSTFSFEVLISTLPLPDVCRLMGKVPSDVEVAASALRATSMALISLGISRPNVLNHHWVYVHDADIPFARLSAPNLWATANAPAQHSSLQAEVYFRGAPPDKDSLTDKCIESLIAMQILKPGDNVVLEDCRIIRYANVVHDRNRAEAVARIHSFLDDSGVFCCGRYGFWDYSLVDEVIEESWRVANNALSSLRATPSSQARRED